MALKSGIAIVAIAAAALTSSVHARTGGTEDITTAKKNAGQGFIVLARFGGANSPGGGLSGVSDEQSFRQGPLTSNRARRFEFGIGRRYRDLESKREFDRRELEKERRRKPFTLFPRDLRVDR